MSKKNSVLRFIFDNHGVRGEIANLHEPLAELIHDSYPKILKKTMMELAIASVLVATTLKDGSEIMVQLRGGKSSKLKYALINIRQDLSFYGSASILEDAQLNDESTLADLTGEDSILVLSVFPKDGPRWQGIVSFNNESVSATLEDYFKDSQQLPTRFFIHTDAENCQCGGLMLQIIPEVKGNLDSLEHLSVLTSTLTDNELFSLSFEEILSRLFAHEEVKVFPESPVSFLCICSKQRCENALMQLSHDELASIANEENGTSMTCQHCGKTYTFTKEELISLLHKASQ